MKTPYRSVQRVYFDDLDALNILHNMRFLLFIARSRVESVYPLVPLFSHQALGVAWLGYDGWLHLGLHADSEVVTELAAVTGDFVAAFEELAALATPVLH